MDRFKFSSLGVFGAKPARASKAVLNPGIGAERALTSKVAGLLLKRGDLLSVEFAGGGGWGDPLEREVGRVRAATFRVRRRRRTTASRSTASSASTPAPPRGYEEKRPADDIARRHRRWRDVYRRHRVR
jgi:N-methylhydantoinase B/oxoprolinase/acetone carboxylase alpha subunit